MSYGNKVEEAYGKKEVHQNILENIHNLKKFDTIGLLSRICIRKIESVSRKIKVRSLMS